MYNKRIDIIVASIIVCLVILVCVGFTYTGRATEKIEQQESETGSPVKALNLDDLAYTGDFLLEVRDVNGDIITDMAGELTFCQKDTYAFVYNNEQTVREKYGDTWVYEYTQIIYFVPGGKLKIYPVEGK